MSSREKYIRPPNSHPANLPRLNTQKEKSPKTALKQTCNKTQTELKYLPLTTTVNIGRKHMSREYALGLDIETTGLEDTALILEVALILFDSKLNSVAHTSETIYHPINEVYAAMGDYVTNMHTTNGLLEDIKNTDSEKTIHTVETHLCDWISENTSGAPLPMLGSSIHFDRTLVSQQMPDLYNKFHYRSIDATSIKLAAEGLSATEIQAPENIGTQHRGYDDLLNSANTIKHYLNHYETR